MEKSPIQTVIFDLGGVLIDWNPRYLYRKLFETEAEITRFLEEICRYEWNVEQDAGRPLKVATELLVQQHPEWEAEIRAYYGRWPEMLGGVIAENVAILEALKAKGQYQLLALTNWSAETFPIALARYDFFRHFDGVVVSGEEQCAKPDPRLYQILMARYAVTPSTAIFIDDSLPNVTAAQALGIHAIHLTETTSLREQLSPFLER